MKSTGNQVAGTGNPHSCETFGDLNQYIRLNLIADAIHCLVQALTQVNIHEKLSNVDLL